MQKVVLNNDVQMPILGCGVFHVTDAEVCERWVLESLTSDFKIKVRYSKTDTEHELGVYRPA